MTNLPLPHKTHPDAVVFSCLGGSQGDLGVVRTLGRMGVRVVLVSEGEGGASAHSRFVSEHHRIASFADAPAVFKVLRGIAVANRVAGKPVLFPTADPDLDFVTQHRDRLAKDFLIVNPEQSIVAQCLDKARFLAFAQAHHFPVPDTWCPERAAEIEEIGRIARFPLILKPAFPPSWSREPLASLVQQKKALTVQTPQELTACYRRIAAIDPRVVVQDYVPGRDDRLYSLHVYMDRQSRPLAWFTGRKLRTYPTYAGIGCFVESVVVPEIIEPGLAMLRRVGYTGFALLQFKRDERDGSFKLLEINPRSSSWNLLAAACGVNLPHVAYLDAIGEPPASPPAQREGVKYLFFDNDLRAFLDYRRHGDITTWQWLASLRGPKVYQLFAADDLGPFLRDVEAKGQRVWRKLGRWLFALTAPLRGHGDQPR
jgi:predicted ATP-grasp superfamily ATP-dependent carboligase